MVMLLHCNNNLLYQELLSLFPDFFKPFLDFVGLFQVFLDILLQLFLLLSNQFCFDTCQLCCIVPHPSRQPFAMLC